MLENIRLKNFKCFEEIDIPMRNVNVLAGVNGMGKSTVIQSLLLLRQSYMENGLRKGLQLNGEYVRLGNGQDVLCEKPSEDKIGLEFCDRGKEYRFIFDYSPEEDLQPLETKSYECEPGCPVFGNQFVYLSAYRVEPQELYRITTEEMLKNREFDKSGEFSFQYLNQFGSEDVKNKAVIIPDRLGESLLNQVRLWMDMISPGVSPQIKVDKQLRKSEIRYEYIEGRDKTSSYKSMNVGFGITYVLPIIIALLSAKENDLIIIENPEAHIHPRGQRMLGELIAAVGSANVQIILETHSDHILNGIRIAVKKQKIEGEKVNLLYFYKDREDYKHKIKNPILHNNGRISEWPEGFFDEWDNALMELL